MLLKISAATILVLSIAVGSAVPLARTANAAEASPAATAASAAQAPAPAPMPLISRNLPAYTNDNCGGSTSASWANDNNYDFGWRSCDTPSTTAPTYLAYDLSSVPAAQRGSALVVWYNDPATLVYDFSYKGVHPYCCWDPYDIPKDYTLEANAGPGGTLPTADWVTLATVTGNKYHSRQAAVDLTGYNWLRLNVTATYGVPNAFGVVANMDIHDASAGLQDDWVFYGDSITEGSLHHYDGDSNVGSFGQMINRAHPSHFPAQEAASIGGTLSVDGAASINSWLPMFPGRYVAIAYGTNDAGWDLAPTAFYNNYVTMVQAVINAGKVPIVPHIPWGCTSQIQMNVPILNQKIDALYTAFPQIIRGPDLWAYFQANQNLISPDCVHPTEPGYWAMRQTWATAMLNAVYAPPPALTISGVQVSSIGATSAVITWQTTNAASSRVDYGTTATYDGNVSDAASVTNHSLGLTGLTGNTTYHYQVTSADTFGQTASSLDATFTTLPLAGTASRFVVAGAASATAGAPFSFTVTAQDDAGNTASDYTGTVHFTSTDTSTGVVLPANTTLTNGQGTFSATLIKAGAQTITAADTVTATIRGTLSLTVRAASAATATLTVPASAAALTPFNVTLTMKDRYGNQATTYTGKVHFTSSDLLATLPADYTFTAADAGRHQFSVTLATPPSQTISARDVANASLGTTSSMITVTVAVPPLPGL